MAQFIKLGSRKWRVRYAAGFLPNGKRRVLNKTVTGSKQDAKKWAIALERERSKEGTVNGIYVLPSGDGFGWLYALRMCIPDYENCPIKIGFSTSVENRKKALCGAGPFPVEWLGCWKAASGRFSEIAFHERFREYRLHGEWFFPHADLIKAVKESIEAKARAA